MESPVRRPVAGACPGALATLVAALLLTPSRAPCQGNSLETAERVQQSMVLIRSKRCDRGFEAKIDVLGAGFALEGLDESAIVTALHVVADCERLTVMDPTGLRSSEARISALDRDNDIAILTVFTPEGGFTEPLRVSQLQPRDVPAPDALPYIARAQIDHSDSCAKGLDALPARPADADADPVETSLRGVPLEVYGRPRAVGFLVEVPLEAPAITYVPLVCLLGGIAPEDRTAIAESGLIDPLHAIVAAFTGNMQPGHSGGPIVDADGRVVAIADGGLEDGAVGLSWGIPISYALALYEEGLDPEGVDASGFDLPKHLWGTTTPAQRGTPTHPRWALGMGPFWTVIEDPQVHASLLFLPGLRLSLHLYPRVSGSVDLRADVGGSFELRQRSQVVYQSPLDDPTLDDVPHNVYGGFVALGPRWARKGVGIFAGGELGLEGLTDATSGAIVPYVAGLVEAPSIRFHTDERVSVWLSPTARIVQRLARTEVTDFRFDLAGSPADNPRDLDRTLVQLGFAFTGGR